VWCFRLWSHSYLKWIHWLGIIPIKIIVRSFFITPHYSNVCLGKIVTVKNSPIMFERDCEKAGFWVALFKSRREDMRVCYKHTTNGLQGKWRKGKVCAQDNGLVTVRRKKTRSMLCIAKLIPKKLRREICLRWAIKIIRE
jgi:hypothetical protein